MKDIFFTQIKLKQRIEELNRYRYRERQVIPFFNVQADSGESVNPVLPTHFSSKITTGSYWKGWDKYMWLQQEVLIPHSWQGRKIVGLFDFGKTGGGTNTGFEMMCYFQGKPYQGVDSNHGELFLPSSVAGQRVELLFRLWSGLNGNGNPQELEHCLKQAEVAFLDEIVDDFYYNAKVMHETIEVLNENSSEKVLLQKTLNDAFKWIDWSIPGSDYFYQTVYQAAEFLTTAIDQFDKKSLVHVTCIGHTHIDVAWLWRLKHTREKCSRSFSTVLRLMEQFPEYVFLQSQPQLYEYIKNDFPEIYDHIRERVAQGRWETDGAMWLEADCNIPSGESLVRQILLGSLFFKKEFGVTVKHLWLPDVFGYSWALPQIMRKSGLETFMTTKISWNQYNRMPHDTFMWKGMDGSEVLTHFITTPEPWCQPGSWFYTYNGQLTPKSVNGIWQAYTDKGITQELLLSYGYGDGGGGVNRDMLEYRRRIDKMPGLPTVSTGKASDYFERLHEKVKETDAYVHTWDGELYLEYHRGTYTSQAYTKKMNRRLEYLYRAVEMLYGNCALATQEWSRYPSEQLEKGWKTILRHQFHDIIPGSSITQVYEDTKMEYAEVEKGALNLLNTLSCEVTETSENHFTLYNATHWSREEWVKIAVKEQGTFYCGKVPLESEKTEQGYWVKVFVEGLGFQTIEFIAGDIQKEESSFYSVESHSIETSEYSIEWNDEGQLTSIYDKRFQREVLSNGKGNVFQLFEDKPLAHDAWDIDIYYQEKMKELSAKGEIKTIAGSYSIKVEFTYRFQHSIIVQEMVLWKASRRIEFKTKVDWHEKRQLLKVAFPVAIRSTHATYDVQFGNVKRPTHWNTSWDMARFETVAHSWVDLSQKEYGVALLNDCKYGHDIKGNQIRLTLIKSAIDPDPIQDQGTHEFTYALYPHEGDFADGDVHVEAFDLNQPLMVFSGKLKDKYCVPWMNLEGEHLYIDAIKKAEEGDFLIIRLHEYAGSSQQACLQFKQTIQWLPCNLLEAEEGEWSTGDKIDFSMAPYEIKSFKIQL